jgi:hypothetical protein
MTEVLEHIAVRGVVVDCVCAKALGCRRAQCADAAAQQLYRTADDSQVPLGTRLHDVVGWRHAVRPQHAALRQLQREAGGAAR